MNETMLMNIHTGSVDTYRSWKEEALLSVGTEGAWSFPHALISETLVEVIKDDSGDWVEAE